MAFRNAFNNSVNKSLGSSIQVPAKHIITPTQNIEKSMKAYLPSYEKQEKYGQDPGTGYEYKLPSTLLRRMYERNVVVRAAVDTIINEVVSANYEIVPIDPEEKLDGAKKEDQNKRKKQIEDFFNHPNENSESFRVVLEKMMWDLLVFDAGVLEKVKSVGGDKLAEIYAVPGDTIRIKVDEHGKILGYWQVIDNKSIKPRFFDKDELIYILMNPRSHTPYGFSPLQTLENIVAAFIYSEHYNVKYFENNATPRGILELGAINEAQLDRFKEYWQQEHLQQPHRVMVLSNPHAHEGKGGVKWIPLAMSSKDMELMNYLNWLMKMILMVYGVTPSEVGFADELRGAPALGQVLQSQAFKNKAIYPMMDRISRSLTEEIISEEFESNDLKFEFVEEKGVQEELQKAQLDALLVQTQIKTVDEIRKERGIETNADKGGAGGKLGDILSRLRGQQTSEEEADMIIKEEGPTIVDTAFTQLKNAVYEELGLTNEIEAKPEVAAKLNESYSNLKNSIEDYLKDKHPNIMEGKTTETSTDQMIEDAFKHLVKEIQLLTTKKKIDSILG